MAQMSAQQKAFQESHKEEISKSSETGIPEISRNSLISREPIGGTRVLSL